MTIYRFIESVFHEIEADSMEEAQQLFNDNPYDYEVGRDLGNYWEV